MSDSLSVPGLDQAWFESLSPDQLNALAEAAKTRTYLLREQEKIQTILPKLAERITKITQVSGFSSYTLTFSEDRSFRIQDICAVPEVQHLFEEMEKKLGINIALKSYMTHRLGALAVAEDTHIIITRDFQQPYRNTALPKNAALGA